MSELGQKILDLVDREPRPLYVPEWGETVYIRPITAVERLRLESAESSGDEQLVSGLILVFSCVGQDGERLWDEGEAKLLLGKASTAVWRIIQAAMEVSCLNADWIDDLKKNCWTQNGQAAGSSVPESATITDSP